MTQFKGYIEDYNTATMPHEKYYNYEKWEMEEYQRKKRKEALAAAQEHDDNHGSFEQKSFNDEEIRRRELKKMKEDAENKEFLSLKTKMSQNKDVQGDMRRQAQLNTELQQAFKRGDTATVKRIERLLAPDEVHAVVKHPWS